MKAVCGICPRRCSLGEGQLGFCRARINRGGKVICENYGRVTSLALDPIEKKPLHMFYPGVKILSVGSYGCNMDCGYCQNCDIARADSTSTQWEAISPEALVTLAEGYRPQGNIGLAFTYNEPLVGYEFVLDCAKLAKPRGLKIVLVTNGMIESEPWERLLPFIDAANIDLKAFSQAGYRTLGGNLDTVKAAIVQAQGKIHLELTTLIVPGLNDDNESIRAEAAWIASVSSGIPLHLSRFFPRHRMRDALATPLETVLRLAKVAREHLPYVFTGNL
ncbi:MAG: AmmeMemoRadiSam system radical SAM enzyme [Eubacteriales bacterium]|nr:AmmeMemoRadiSam system radical SAM enzyme [Eubacteriales bacterium]